MAIVACEKPPIDTGQSGQVADAGPSLSLRYTDAEVSRDSHVKEVLVTLEGFDLRYELAHGGFGAEHFSDVDTTVELDADEIARIEEWIAEAGLMGIASLDDTSPVEPGPHHRRGLSASITYRGQTHEFRLDGVTSVKGSPTAFGERQDLARAERLVTRLTDLVRDKDPRAFRPRKRGA